MAKQDETKEFIDKVLFDATLLQKLSDKVYELMLEDLRNQSGRTGNFRR
ncbi:MAG: hypothetical protein U7127_04945 [Phormidium sp.]